jgi:hypothetical protein
VVSVALAPSSGLETVKTGCNRCVVRWAVDYDQRAVVVEYQVEAAVLNETGEVIQVDTRPHRKVYVHTRRLNPCVAFATAIGVGFRVLPASLQRWPSVTHSIHLKKLDGNTNVDVLAQGIIDRCEMIHPSRLPKLIELLSDMQVRIVEEEKKMESAAEFVCDTVDNWGCVGPACHV